MPLAWLETELARLRERGLLRVHGPELERPGPRIVRGGVELINLCSNDYLSLAGDRAQSFAGSGASRLIAGDLAVHRELERALAQWLGVEAVLLFSSGYAANVGAIAALAGAHAGASRGERTLIVSDALDHASIIDGCRLSRARVVVTPHRDVEAVERALAAAPEPRRLVVTDAFFSMEATLAPLGGLAAVCARHGAALYVDEAHALGVWGPEGRGASAAAGIRPDVLVGTLGKAFGASGAFVAGSAALIDWMWNAARSFVFSTGLAPAATAAALRALGVIRAGERTAMLHERAARLRAALPADWVLAGSVGPIVPVVVGDATETVSRARALEQAGVFVQAVRPPTVPEGTSRLRLTVQAGHSLEDIDRAAAAVRAAFAGAPTP